MKNILRIIVISLTSCVANAIPTLQPNSDNILRVGIVPFTEPFIMQASSTEYYGFDISVMNAVCKSINKTCSYIPVKRTDLLTAFSNDALDVAIGDFVINTKMQQYVFFSIPYMTSQAQFIGLQTNSKLDMNAIENMRIGVINNSAYQTTLATMNFPDSNVKTFETDNDIIAAVKANRIDLGFVNSYIANYWQHNANGVIYPVGQPVTIGFGLGVIINPSKQGLVSQINIAIYNYQNSPDFKNNFNMYLNGLQ